MASHTRNGDSKHGPLRAVARLRAHFAAELLPRLTAEELANLTADIKVNGIIHPIITVSHEGERVILDGLSRQAALESLGMVVGPEHIREITTPADPLDYVLSANLHRRHLSSEQKRELAAKVLKLRPERSDRQIAATCGVSGKTVGSVRSELEAKAEIPHKPERVEPSGRRARGRKPNPARSAHATKTRRPSQTNSMFGPKLNSLAWSEASSEARTKFIDAVGPRSIWEAMTEAHRLAIGRFFLLPAQGAIVTNNNYAADPKPA
jgi:ParB-like chromosome segregation protein Spo0J